MPQTSLLSGIIALSEFFIHSFPHTSWYPYWYLGNPYYFLIGPVVPIALGILGKIGLIRTNEGYLLLILASFIFGGFGLYFFLRDCGIGKKQTILSSTIYSIFPAGFFLFFYQSGLHHISFSFLPFLFLVYRRFLASGPGVQRVFHPRGVLPTAILISHLRGVILFLSLFVAFLLLIDVSVILPLVVGCAALFIAQNSKNGKEEKIVKSILILLFGIFLSTLWYTPKFWWVILANPSFGGVPMFQLLQNLFQFLLQFVPIILAVFVVKWRKYKLQGITQFAFLFLVSFLFLTLVRFISDPDFIMDWIGFSLEMQFGGAILLGSLLEKFLIFPASPAGRSFQFSIRQLADKFQINNVKGLIVFIGLILSISVSLIIVKDLFASLKIDYQRRIISVLKNNVNEHQRVFLSGSSVFWINSYLPIQQVRGGKDEASIHPWWRHAAYQIREGKDLKLTELWLKALGVSYVLVHADPSAEPFRDFKYKEKYGKLRLIKENNGDWLYKIQDSSISRVASSQILSVPTPNNGADITTIKQYVDTFKQEARLEFGNPDKIHVQANVHTGEVVSLAISYDPSWNIIKGEGKIVSDAIGNMVVIPKNNGGQEFELTYKRNIMDILLPIFSFFVMGVFFVRFDSLYPKIKKRIPRLSIGMGEEE